MSNIPEEIRILVVEDDETTQQLLKDLLEDKNYNVSTASNGQRALERVKNNHFDLILLDENLPEMNGSEVLLKIKANPEKNHIPVIFLTSQKNPSFITDMLDKGSDDFITKPFKMDILLARINAVLRRVNSSNQNPSGIDIQVPENMESLNPKEIEVLGYVAKGYSNKKISKLMFLSDHTIYNHVKSILKKLNADNRTHAALLAFKMNLLD